MKIVSRALRLRVGDSFPPAQIFLQHLEDDPAGASATFELRSYPTGDAIVEAPADATASPEPAGVGYRLLLSYPWPILTDDIEPGLYYGRFLVTFPGGSIGTYPADGRLLIDFVR